MSSNQEEQTSIEDEARKKFEPARGSVPQQLDVSEGEHPIREALGKSSHRKLKAHEGTLGERFAFRYSRSEAFIREYLANAETGCIRAARFELKQIDTDTYNSEWFSSHSIPELLDEARSRWLLSCNRNPHIATGRVDGSVHYRRQWYRYFCQRIRRPSRTGSICIPRRGDTTRSVRTGGHVRLQRSR